MRGAEIVAIAVDHGWVDCGPGGKHPYILKRKGALRPVPIRAKLENKEEVRGILKQLEIPKDEWPEKVK